MKRKAIILGSTGSIGRSTLEVIDAMADEWEICGLAAGCQWELLAKQAEKYKPEAIAIAEPGHESKLNGRLGSSSKLFCGDGALERLVNEIACDCVVAAVVGVQGLAATLAAARLGRRIALANKEALVIAGALVIPLAKESGATIIPVDSEHSAIFQALQAGKPGEVASVYLTASGGPFRTWTLEEMSHAGVEEALRHPTWDMGPKVTIDSATMMNKALEIVEAHWLFDLDPNRIRVLIHPESIIHSLVEFSDGSIMAQLGAPDMRTPIQYALTYPARKPGPSDRLDLSKALQLNLSPPDLERFPAVEMGYEVARRGGTSGAVLNAANESAVALFQEGAIPFTDIARHVRHALEEHRFVSSPSLDDLLEADRWAREEVDRCIAC